MVNFVDDSGLNNEKVVICRSQYKTWRYFGDCINTVDIDYLWDATQMAQVIDDSCLYVGDKLLLNGDRKVPKQAFSSNVVCGVNEKQKIGFIYNIDNDIHYFFDVSATYEELNEHNDNLTESKADEQKLIDFAGPSLAKRFLSIKNRLKSPENDIYYWLKKDVIELEDKVNEVENTTSKTKQKEIEKTEGAELIADENGWKVYRVDTYEASCLYGKDTKWCTASTKTNKHFMDYKNKGIVLYYFIKGTEKYALALYPKTVNSLEKAGIKANYELYDSKDVLITDLQRIKKLNLPQLPGVNLILELLPTEIEGDVLVRVYPYNTGEFVIPDGIKKIDEYAFFNCESLTSITIPDSVTEIGDGAFYHCESLTSITIPNSVTEIGEYAFGSCKSLTSITIPNSVTKIGNSAFSYCKSLTSITIPNSVTKIGNSAFSTCESLTSVTIPNSVTKIGDSAFFGCESLTSITIPNSVTKIVEHAFTYCKSLTSIAIPNSVTEIGEYAFSHCESLTSITIPDRVTKIGNGAFYQCESLTIYAKASKKPKDWDEGWNSDNRPVVWNYKKSPNQKDESIAESKRYEKAIHARYIRFINKNEYDALKKDGLVLPINTGFAWAGKKRLYAFPLNTYQESEFFKVKEYLEAAFDIDYDYAIYLSLNHDERITFAAYDVDMVHQTLGKRLAFDIDDDSYDTGPVYVIPEVRLSQYTIKDVRKIVSLKDKKESTKQMQNKRFESFAQFIKEWRDNPITNVEGFRKIIEDLSMTEDMEIDYNKLPVQVSYAKMPIIVDGIASVKVVVITQADSFALIIPDEIYKAYEVLEKDPSEISSINMGIQLMVDSAGFDSSDPEFQKLIQRAYVAAAGSSTAYELSNAVKASVEDKVEDDEDEEDIPMGGFENAEDEINKSPEPMFEEPSDMDFPEEISKNMEAYSKFSKSTNALDMLLESIKKSPEIIRENIKAKYIGKDKNVLSILVDNKSIYRSFINIPKKAKDTLTKFGESLRLNKDTQIVDTFIKDGHRVFIIAEYVGNNYWFTNDDEISDIKPAGKLVLPKNYIKLESSSVRIESRKFRPIKYEGKIVFHISK